MDKHIIGENAGILWRLLNTDPHKKWEYSEIKKLTDFDDAELGSAIGWLAREDKINSNWNITKVRIPKHLYILC